MTERYQVLIYFNRKSLEPEGVLTGQSLNKMFMFDPRLIIPDLLDDKENPFGMKVKMTKTEKEQYTHLLEGIDRLVKESIHEQKCIDLSTLELLRPYYELTYDFNPTAILNDQECKLYYDSFSVTRRIIVTTYGRFTAK